MNDFVIKDGGARTEFASGMVRDTAEGKIDWELVFNGPMLERWAIHLTKGNAKYPDPEPGKANWQRASGIEEQVRFRKAAARHFAQWMRGDQDEDHAAAVFFNLNGYEYVKKARVDAAYKKVVASVLEQSKAANAQFNAFMRPTDGNPWNVKAPTEFEVARAKARANVRRDESDEPLESIERDPFNLDGGRY